MNRLRQNERLCKHVIKYLCTLYVKYRSVLSTTTEKNYYLLNKNCFCTPVFVCVCGGGVFEGSLLLAVLRTNIRARGISDVMVGGGTCVSASWS
jgi:hypothetical protein